MASLAKGLAILCGFSGERPFMSLSEAAATAGLSRAATRRALITLVELGYVLQEGRAFTLSPRVLELGFAFLSSQSWIDRAEPLMRTLSRDVGESCFAAVLHGTDIVFVSCVQAPHRLMSTSISIGTRLPAFHTALGRIQLGFLDDGELWHRLRSIRIEPHTLATIVDPSALVDHIREDHVRGFSIVDEELERGLRAIAVPIVSRGGRNLGAVSVSVQAGRTTRNEMREHLLPRLNAIAAEVVASSP